MLSHRSGFHERFFSRTEIQRTHDWLWPRWLNTARHHRDAIDSAGVTLQIFLKGHDRLVAEAMRAIRDGTYTPFPGRAAVIYADKPRSYVRLPWIDKWVISHLARLYAELADAHLDKSVYSYRTGVGQHAALKAVSDYIRQHRKSEIYRTDIESFGENLAHSWLLRDFCDVVSPSEELKRLFLLLVRFPIIDREMTVYLIRGLPMGSYLQLVAENVYLRELDRSLAGLTGGMYARYGDDIFVACQEPTLMDEAIRTVSSFCASRDLKLSRNKSRRYTLLAPHAQESNMPVRTDSAIASSFRYLGKQIMWNGEILLPRDKIRTVMNFIEQRLRRSLKQTSRGTLEERVALLCRASQTIVQGIGQWSCEPVRSYLEEVREPAQLKALDRQLMELVVSLARGTSFVRGDFRRFSPKQLREYGLVSFVHWKRTRRAYEVGGLR